MNIDFKSYFNKDHQYDELMEFRGANPKTGEKWIESNQLTRLPKMGFFIPYSGVLDKERKHENKFYSLEDSGPLKDPLLTKNRIQKLDSILKEVSNNIGKLGIRSQKQSLVLIEFPKNAEALIKEVGDKDIYGYADPRTGTIFVNKGLFFGDIERFKYTVTHEFAHSVWYKQFDKETKEKFVSWYKDNVVSPSFKSYYGHKENQSDSITSTQAEEIWHASQSDTSPLRRKLDRVLPEIVMQVTAIKPSTSVKSYLGKTFTSAFKRNPNILKDKESFKKVLSKLSFKTGLQSVPSKLEKDEFQTLRSLAFEKGSTPSEYAATNPEELWAEAIAYATENLGNLSKSLKSMIVNMLSGTA
jgi:hypothetical protein